jgi:O-antigen/teichoic acid export membrane protein
MQKRSISKNTVYLLIGNLGGTGLAFLLSLLIGRILGAEALGIYSAVLAWIFSLSMLVDFGISSLFTRDLAQATEKIPVYLQTALRQRWLFGGLLTSALIFAVSFLSNDPAIRLGLRISAPLLLIEPLFGLYTAIFRAQERMLPIAVLNIGMLIFQLGFSVLLIGQGIIALLVVNMLTSLGRLCLGWLYYRSDGNLRRSSPSIQLISLSEILRLAAPFAFAGLLIVAQQRLGILMLESLSDLEQLGRYAAVMRLIEAGRIIPNAFFGALFPALASLATTGQALNRYFLRVILGLSAFGMAIAVIGSFFSLQILDLSYGADFLEAEIVLKLGLWSLLPSLLRGARTLYCYAQGRESYVNFVTFLALVLQLTFGFYLIPLLGALGLVLALLVVETLGLMLLYLPQNRVK